MAQVPSSEVAFEEWVQLPHERKRVAVNTDRPGASGVDVRGIGSLLTPEQAENFGLALIRAATVARMHTDSLIAEAAVRRHKEAVT
jgi:hypothetical protein